ncbi:hypothetical protein SARC_03864 [Sphaeroforma arctica JP610]|uniref:C2H2-type domain-containing protein n=1 Tax=Sphaeroforma arctica JP610 TaxID=667725 RepID=A0A0L0G4C1_9EUKA|nr:hypothetical protein SARC_03864 [Sphaeroforma arctica JP610]KNC83905.1 hypothetical protein SARC_03864 [Sphaeroforma arctica JP610]|eukprot:XP_014157807.1 hypothetical protein SARC_03864 [Sphaeroforma arctica JP610]
MSFSISLGALRRIARTTTRTRPLVLTPDYTAKLKYSACVSVRPRHGLPMIARLCSSNSLSVRTIRSTYATVKPYACEYPNCVYSSGRRTDLKVHMRVHTGERPYACDFPGCGSSFAHRTTLVNHKRVYSGERPFACDFLGCGNTFSQRTTLANHIRIHCPIFVISLGVVTPSRIELRW